MNATAAPVSVPSQDGDIYSKRESRDAKGNWLRCDRHGYSWCGNSYLPVTVPSGEFYGRRQLLNSAKGEIRPVRFRLYNENGPALVSNEGQARIDPADLDQCRYDAMGLRLGPLEDVAAVASGKAQFSGGQIGDPLLIAIHALRRFPNDPRLFDTVVELIQFLRKSNDTAARGRQPILEAGFASRYQSEALVTLVYGAAPLRGREAASSDAAGHQPATELLQ